MAVFFSSGALLGFDHQRLTSSLSVQEGERYLVVDDMVFDVEIKDEFQIRAFTGDKWPNAEVFFEYASDLTKSMKSQFEKACQEWSSASKVKFTERTNQSGYIHVENASVNQASVGYAAKKRTFKIYNWSNHIIVAHELGHTLGLSHEHCRSDRDSYVKIHLDNIPDEKEHNFDIYPSSVNYSEYDFESIMHYKGTAFAEEEGKPTISAQPKYKDKERLMGNRQYLSSNDKADMASHYGK